MSAILITGAAGFIGSHLVDRLLSLGHKVTGVDDFETGRKDNLPNLGTNRFSFFCVSISHGRPMHHIFSLEQPEVVIHAAASYKNPDDWLEDADTNCVGSAVVAKLSKEFGVKRLIYLQTSLCYGLDPYGLDPWKNVRLGEFIRCNCPDPEGHHPQIQINHILDPAPNSYAITKTAGEQLIAMSGVPFVSFRLANIYGPRNLAGAIPTFYKKLSEGEKCTIVNTRRDFVYIDDLIDLLVRAINGEGSGNYYHVSTGRDYKIAEIYGFMCGCMFPGSYKTIDCTLKEKNPDDAETILLDPSKTWCDFPGWKAQTPINEGLKKTIEWYQTHEFEEAYTHLKKD